MPVHPVEFARAGWHTIQRWAPAWVESSLLPLLFQSKDLMRLLARPRLPTNEFFDSDSAGSPRAVGIGLSSMATLHFEMLAQWPSERPSSDTPFWKLRAAGLRKSADLVAVEGPSALIKTLPRRNAFVLPRLVSHTLDVTGTWQDVCQRFHKSTRSNELRWVRKYGYRFEKTTELRHFEHFYENMYLPTMNGRHGSAGALAHKAKAHEFFKNGFLVRVFKGETWVAAALCEFRACGLRLCELGVLESNDELIKQGAMGAIYVGAIQEANALKCQKIDLTVTSSLLSNGTFQHKRRWGTTASLPISDQKRIWIQVARYTPAVHRLMVENPMITVDGKGELHALVAVESLDSWTCAEAAQWRKRFFMPGLNSIKILPLDRFRETGVLSFVTGDPEIRGTK
jgi:hypothetical protein